MDIVQAQERTSKHTTISHATSSMTNVESPEDDGYWLSRCKKCENMLTATISSLIGPNKFLAIIISRIEQRYFAI